MVIVLYYSCFFSFTGLILNSRQSTTCSLRYVAFGFFGDGIFMILSNTSFAIREWRDILHGVFRPLNGLAWSLMFSTSADESLSILYWAVVLSMLLGPATSASLGNLLVVQIAK